VGASACPHHFGPWGRAASGAAVAGVSGGALAGSRRRSGPSEEQRRLKRQNIVILAGNIGQPPETRTTQGGTSITHFTLATSRPRYSEGRVIRDENGYRVQDTEWHRITCFNGLGKTVQEHCDKGMKVLVRGRIHYTKWTDAAGVDRYGCEMIAETVDVLSRAKQTESDDGKFIDNDNIPFCAGSPEPGRAS